VEHLVKVGTHAKVLEELKVTSKPAKVKGKPGRRKQKVAVEDLDDDGAEAEEPAGEQLCTFTCFFLSTMTYSIGASGHALAHRLPNQKYVSEKL